MLLQKFGSQGDMLHQIIFADVMPTNLSDEQECYFYKFPLKDNSSDNNNHVVFIKLKSFFIDIPVCIWIEIFNVRRTGCREFLLRSNYYNVQGQLIKRTDLAKSQLDELYYKNESSISFEHYTELLKHSFPIFDQDKDDNCTDW